MLERAIDTARAHDVIRTVVLEAFADNEPALRLYRRAGFVEEGRMRNYARRADGSFVDAVIMALHLDS